MDRRYIIAGLLFVAAVIIATVLAYPAFVKERSLARQVAEKSDAVDEQRSLLKEIKDIEQRYKATQASMQRMFSIMPTWNAASMPNLFIELEGLAGTSGLSADDISLSEKIPTDAQGKKGEGYRVVTAQIGAQGTYESMKRFLAAVEQNQHLMDVTTVVVAGTGVQRSETASTTESAIGSAPAGDALSYVISLDAYYQ